MVKETFLALNSTVPEQDQENIQIMKAFWIASRVRLLMIGLKTDSIWF